MSTRSHARAGRRSPSPRQAVLEARDLSRIARWHLRRRLDALAPVSFHFRLAVARGTLDWVSVERRTRLMKTLETHLGQTTSRRELERIARRHLQALRKEEFTNIWPRVHDFAGIEAVPIEGLEQLDGALDRGKGVILASAHYGYARMIKPVLRSHGRRALLVGTLPRSPGSKPSSGAHRPRRRTRAERFARRLDPPRDRSGDLRGDFSTSFDLRPVLDALERNEAVIIMVDGRRAEALHSLLVAGIEIPFAPGAVSIARSTGAALLPTFVVDEPGQAGPGSLRLVIHPPVHLQVTENVHEDLDVNLRRFADVYGVQIRAYPHNLVWSRVRNGAFEAPAPTRRRAASLSPSR